LPKKLGRVNFLINFKSGWFEKLRSCLLWEWYWAIFVIFGIPHVIDLSYGIGYVDFRKKIFFSTLATSIPMQNRIPEWICSLAFFFLFFLFEAIFRCSFGILHLPYFTREKYKMPKKQQKMASNQKMQENKSTLKFNFT